MMPMLGERQSYQSYPVECVNEDCEEYREVFATLQFRCELGGVFPMTPSEMDCPECDEGGEIAR